MPEDLCRTKAKTLIIVGGKELSVMKKSAALLYKTINGSFIKVIEKSRHGEISLIYPDKYINLIKQFF